MKPPMFLNIFIFLLLVILFLLGTNFQLFNECKGDHSLSYCLNVIKGK